MARIYEANQLPPPLPRVPADATKLLWKQRYQELSALLCGRVPVVSPLAGACAEHREGAGTVFIFTSGTQRTQRLKRQCAGMFRNLGFTPVVVRGVDGDTFQFPSKSGCKASFAWYLALLPKLLACLEGVGDQEPVAVVEDSCQPTVTCTPARLRAEYDAAGKAVWAGAYLKPKRRAFHITVRGADLLQCPCSGISPAGAKLFVGSKTFWRQALAIFEHTDKSMTTDGVFQILEASGQLHLCTPFLAATQTHHSERTGHPARASPAALPLDAALCVPPPLED